MGFGRRGFEVTATFSKSQSGIEGFGVEVSDSCNSTTDFDSSFHPVA
jgi:hypothetical protein